MNRVKTAAKNLAVEAGCLLLFLKHGGVDITKRPYIETAMRIEEMKNILGPAFMEAGDEGQTEIDRTQSSTPSLRNF